MYQGDVKSNKVNERKERIKGGLQCIVPDTSQS